VFLVQVGMAHNKKYL